MRILTYMTQSCLHELGHMRLNSEEPPRQCQNVVPASELRARAAVTLQFWHFATSTSNDKNRHDKVWDRHIHDKIKRR